MDCTAISEWRDEQEREEGYTDRETIKCLPGEVAFKTVTLEPFIPGQERPCSGLTNLK